MWLLFITSYLVLSDDSTGVSNGLPDCSGHQAAQDGRHGVPRAVFSVSRATSEPCRLLAWFKGLTGADADTDSEILFMRFGVESHSKGPPDCLVHRLTRSAISAGAGRLAEVAIHSSVRIASTPSRGIGIRSHKPT